MSHSRRTHVVPGIKMDFLDELDKQNGKYRFNLWYWFTNHVYSIKWYLVYLWSRPHLVDTRDKVYGYSGGYIDKDEQLLLASFRLLTDFVEKEKPFDIIYTDKEPTLEDAQKWCCGPDTLQGLIEQHKTGQEIKALYTWWTVERPKEHSVVEALQWNEGRFKLEADLVKKDDEMLHRLINVRQGLWT